VRILVLEFKVGAATFDRSAVKQVYDHALDLKNFHNGSHRVAMTCLGCIVEMADVEALFRQPLYHYTHALLPGHSGAGSGCRRR
jgi:ABC-type oligopeptide transport system ATPase subunit